MKTPLVFGVSTTAAVARERESNWFANDSKIETISTIGVGSGIRINCPPQNENDNSLGLSRCLKCIPML